MKVTEEKLQTIVKLVESLPERYRDKCFEIMLQSEIYNSGSTDSSTDKTAREKDPLPIQDTFKLPIIVKSFLSQYNLDEKKVVSLFHIEGENIIPAFNIKSKNKKSAQTEISLIMSLENGIINNKFGFELKKLRERCINEKCYDLANFKTYLKQSSSLYNTTEKEDILLSPTGKSELANLLSENLK